MRNSSKIARLEKIDEWLLRVSRWISYLVGVALLAIMILAFLDIIAAKFFNSMIPSATEWITYLNVVAVFPAVAYVQLSRGHTNVEFLNEYLPKPVQKGIRIFSDILGAVVSGLVAWRAYVQTANKYASHEMSSSSALAKGSFPIWPFALVLAIGMTLLAIAFLWCVVREVYNFGPKVQAENSGEKAEESGAGSEEAAAEAPAEEGKAEAEAAEAVDAEAEKTETETVKSEEEGGKSS